MGFLQEIGRSWTARAMKPLLRADEQVVDVINRHSWWLLTKRLAVLTTDRVFVLSSRFFRGTDVLWEAPRDSVSARLRRVASVELRRSDGATTLIPGFWWSQYSINAFSAGPRFVAVVNRQHATPPTN
jgi:hypothetical protein